MNIISFHAIQTRCFLGCSLANIYQENAKGMYNQLGFMSSLWASEVQLTAFCGNYSCNCIHIYTLYMYNCYS